MQELDQKIIDLMNQTPQDKRFLVTAHSAFSYFTKRYIAQSDEWHNHCIAPEGLAPEAQISLYDIEKVVSYIKTNSVGIIFSESNVSKDALKKILDVCKKSGFEIQLFHEPLFGDALFNEKSYLDMMWHNATLLHKAWYDDKTAQTQD
jgi:manganese/zinc/iron transport system substrate-binding protein